jgi:hypothetical protein
MEPVSSIRSLRTRHLSTGEVIRLIETCNEVCLKIFLNETHQLVAYTDRCEDPLGDNMDAVKEAQKL